MAGRMHMGIPRERIPWQPSISTEKCISCCVCLDTCPNSVFVLNEGEGIAEVADPENCVVLCDKCAEFCEQEAITFPDKAEMKQLIGRLVREV